MAGYVNERITRRVFDEVRVYAAQESQPSTLEGWTRQLVSYARGLWRRMPHNIQSVTDDFPIGAVDQIAESIARATFKTSKESF